MLEESLDVLGGLLLEGPWGLPPPFRANLSLENCKFISQKGPRAGEGLLNGPNHFLQSLTELGGWGCSHRRVGGSIPDLSTLVSFLALLALGPGHGARKRGPEGRSPPERAASLTPAGHED